MEDLLKIYIDRLRGGTTEKLSGLIPPVFLSVEDKGLRFLEPVEISGEVYIAEKTLIIHFKAQLTVSVPCIVCGEWFDYPLKLQSIYMTVPLEEVTSGIYDITGKLRDEILLEVPNYVECNEGKCPYREEIKKFLVSDDSASQEDTYYPFKEL